MNTIYGILESTYNISKDYNFDNLYIDYYEENILFELATYKNKEDAIDRISTLLKVEGATSLTEEEEELLKEESIYNSKIVYTAKAKIDTYLAKYEVVEISLK
jgi:hypothetical protein